MDSQIICADCFDLLPRLPPACADILFVDPPYNIGIDYGAGAAADSLPPNEYLARMESLIQQGVRLLTPAGSLWFLCPERWADHIGLLLSKYLPRRNRIIWRETFGQYREQCFPSGHRHLFWHARDPCPFYTDDIRVTSQRMEAGDPRAKGPRVPDDVWDIPRLVGNAHERCGRHPCQLPEALLERAILCSTAPNNLVLDPMAGTGTALRVAQRLGRRYVGIEQQPSFVQLIEKRLGQAYQPKLFG